MGLYIYYFFSYMIYYSHMSYDYIHVY